MMWNLEKLEQERLDLIEVITALRHTERLSTADRTSIFEKITAHMVRLPVSTQRKCGFSRPWRRAENSQR